MCSLKLEEEEEVYSLPTCICYVCCVLFISSCFKMRHEQARRRVCICCFHKTSIFMTCLRRYTSKLKPKSFPTTTSLTHVFHRESAAPVVRSSIEWRRDKDRTPSTSIILILSSKILVGDRHGRNANNATLSAYYAPSPRQTGKLRRK